MDITQTKSKELFTNTLTKEEKHVLLHSLGWSDLRWYDKNKLEETPYRNYFYTGEDTTDYPIICSLIEKKLMFCSGASWDNGASKYYHVTEQGIDLAYSIARNLLENSKPTRSKRRYQAYLHSESDESFIEWLRNSYWDDYRKRYDCV